MGYCKNCAKRSTAYCFVHKRHVCDDCLGSPDNKNQKEPSPCEGNCVVKSYFSWIADADYDWPPKCGCCNRSMSTGRSNLVRLNCYCTFHKTCMTKMIKTALSKAGDTTADSVICALKCPDCQSLVLDPKAKPSALKQAVADFLQQARAPSPSPTASSSFLRGTPLTRRVANTAGADEGVVDLEAAGKGTTGKTRRKHRNRGKGQRCGLDKIILTVMFLTVIILVGSLCLLRRTPAKPGN